jgi:hypothetical protein
VQSLENSPPGFGFSRKRVSRTTNMENPAGPGGLFQEMHLGGFLAPRLA